MAIAPSALASYAQLALEYYDPQRHPTCANLREASAALLREWISVHAESGAAVLETGAGRSLATDLANQLGLRVALTVSDKSPEMLAKTPLSFGEGRIILDAECMAVQNSSFDVIVSSLGDPYNTEAFWRECARILRPNGYVFFTTPSFAWASRFRTETGAPAMAAEFWLAEGRTLFVPSFVFSHAAQKRMIHATGLRVEAVEEVHASEIRNTTRSSKLRDCALVTGYCVRLSSRV